MAGKKWTKEEDLYLLNNYHLKTPRECQEDFLFDRSVQAIYHRASSLKLKPKQNQYAGLTHQQYEDKIFDSNIEAVPLENYKGYDTPILHECYHGHQTLRSPSNVLKGSKCAVCSNNIKKTTEEYKQELVDKGIGYTLQGNYINTDTPVNHICPKCKKQWKVKPTHILRGSGCPVCNRPGGYSHTRFDNDRELANSPGILYCVVLVNRETFEREVYKIGITKGKSDSDVFKRFAGFTNYEARILKLCKGTLENVFLLEQKLHQQWSHLSKIPTKKFGGYSECFEINQEILDSIPDQA